MFLNRLDSEEKVAFLKLAHYLARVDGNFSDEEIETINTYCMEMQMEDIEYNENSFVLDETLNIIKNDENKKIVLLEIMALVYSDGLDEKEEKILNIIAKKYNISSALFTVYSEWSKAILAIVTQGQALISL